MWYSSNNGLKERMWRGSRRPEKELMQEEELDERPLGAT
jgi:hypothetical protein